MNIAIDMGNSAAKVGIFTGVDLSEQFVIKDSDELAAKLNNFSGANLIVSSVGKDIAGFDFKNAFNAVVHLTATTPVPISIEYETPETLGVDRIAAVCGAFDLFPKKNCLVIDAGTCVTYELLTSDGTYLGGGISPGLSMRFQAMNRFTARLPLVEPEQSPALYGKSTASCMQTGVVNGLTDEINGAISRYSSKFEDLRVILTGGDCRFFENQLKGTIFAIPELVLKGLNTILLHNIRD